MAQEKTLTPGQADALKAIGSVLEVMHTRGTGAAYVAGTSVPVHTLRALQARGFVECHMQCASRVYTGRRLGSGRSIETTTSYWRITNAGRARLGR